MDPRLAQGVYTRVGPRYEKNEKPLMWYQLPIKSWWVSFKKILLLL
jgi:hypothetical protein